jgi:phage terminase large subunit
VNPNNLLKIGVSRIYTKIKNAVRPRISNKDADAILKSGRKLPGYRYIVNSGSTRSTKTWSIWQWIIEQCVTYPKLRVVVVRAKLAWLRKTAYKDFVEIMLRQGLWNDTCMNKGEWEYTFPNGSNIVFTGLDQDSGFMKAHGTPSDILYCNEITELGWSRVQQLEVRNTWICIFDFNPNCPTSFWIYTEILNRVDDAILIHSTYKDNPWLPIAIVRSIEAYEPTEENIARGTADEMFWRIYGLGLQGVIKGLIYPNIKIVKGFPDKITSPGYALDWGFTNDPTTLCFYGMTPGNIWMDQMLYETGLVNLAMPSNPGIRSIEGEFLRLGVKRELPIYCDGAEPKSVADLRNAGYNAIGVAGSGKAIIPGIQSVKRFNINVTERSLEGIIEFNNYKWKDLKGNEGEAFINEPVDAFNHVLDGLRYYCMSVEPGSFLTMSHTDAMSVSIPKRRSRIDSIMDEDIEEDRRSWASSLGCNPDDVSGGFRSLGN